MKTSSYLCGAILVLPLCASAQISVPPAARGPVKVEAGPHHRVWQTVTTDDQGRAITNSYTELATGLNFLNPATGLYEESQEQFETTKDGHAVATKGQHQVGLAADINSAGSVETIMPDGQRLISNPMGLSFRDLSSGKNVLIAQATNSIGELLSSNVINYPDAFDTLKAAIRYTYTKSGFSQDIILYQNPGSPADYGLDPATTVLEMYTEFFSPPTPTIQTSPDSDQTLDFGQMQMGRGVAYLQNQTLQAIPVTKEWAQIQSRYFLIEAIPYQQVKPLLDNLQASVLKEKKEAVAMRAAPSREKLVAMEAMRPKSKFKQVASIKPGQSIQQIGFLMDYTLNSSQTNFTFSGDETYYVSANVILSGTNTTFESGTVIKYTNNVSLTVNSPITWQGANYRPIVLVSKDDDSLGALITGSTGNPTNNYYATSALTIGVTNAVNLQNLRVANAQTAISLSGGSGHVIRNAQLLMCQKGIAATSAEFSLRNALLHNVLTNFTGSSSTGRVEQMTVNTASWLNKDIGSNLFLTNCLLVAVTNSGSYSGNTVSNVTSPSGVFQAVGAGFHYLANDNYRNRGTTTINGALLLDLKKKTTYPPLVLTNTYNYCVILNPQAQRDTDTPDLGFHYDPIDYAINTLTMTNATLVLTNGVALATFGNIGILLSDGSKLCSEGTPVNHNHLSRYFNIQEQSTNWGAGWYSAMQTINPYNFGVAPPSAQIRFTDFDSMSAGGRHIILLPEPNPPQWTLTSLLLEDCSLNTGEFNLSGDNNSTYSLNNNLFERVQVLFQGDYTDQSGQQSPQINCYNNLYRYGTIFTWNFETNKCVFKDNTFDSTVLSDSGYPLAASYNAYINMGTNRYFPTNANDQVLTSFTYATGALGNYYQLSTNLYDKGSRSSTSANLSDYTVKTNQTKEGTSMVEVGYHYVALTNGVPYDNDGDGIPDYIENRTNSTCGCLAPSVTLTNPVNSQLFVTSPTNIVMDATASDPDGWILYVEFFNGPNKLGTVYSAPYQFVWTNVNAGSYTLSAKATDDTLLSATSANVSITLNPLPCR
jgi:Bacterial Ig domain